MNIYFDIETIPCQDAILLEVMRNDMKAELTEALDAVRAPGNYKDEVKIAEYVDKMRADLLATHEAKVADAILKTSFDGGLGQICVIGVAVDGGDADSFTANDLSPKSEFEVLEGFFAHLNDVRKTGDQVCFVGHNLIEFDIRFVWQRAMIHGIRPPHFFPRDPKPWADSVFDTMQAWSGLKRGGSMDKLCRIFGIPGKGDMDGSKVWPMVQAGRIEHVADYCRGDVDRTRALHKRMTFAD